MLLTDAAQVKTDAHSGSITDLQATSDKTMIITFLKDTTAKVCSYCNPSVLKNCGQSCAATIINSFLWAIIGNLFIIFEA